MSSTRTSARSPASLPLRLPERWAWVRRRLRWHRRAVGAGCLGAAVAAALLVVSPPAAPQRRTAVAARDLPAGAVLARADLRSVLVPAGLVPAAALGASSALGRRLASGLRAGEYVTDLRLTGTGLVDAVGPGRVLVPVSLADPGEAQLVRVGDRVDVVAATAYDPATYASAPGSPAPGWRVATAARVLAAPTRPAPAGLLSPGDAGTTPLLLAVTPPEALQLAGAASGLRLSLVIIPRQD